MASTLSDRFLQTQDADLASNCINFLPTWRNLHTQTIVRHKWIQVQADTASATDVFNCVCAYTLWSNSDSLIERYAYGRMQHSVRNRSQYNSRTVWY